MTEVSCPSFPCGSVLVTHNILSQYKQLTASENEDSMFTAGEWVFSNSRAGGVLDRTITTNNFDCFIFSPLRVQGVA